MRVINEFAEQPKATEVIVIDGRASVFIREDIRSEETEDGVKWFATEYSTQVNARGFEVTDEFIEQLKANETEKAAAEVRAKRNALLDESDKEVLPDRLTKTSAAFKAWADYREALREIPDQEGFPFDVVFPAKPE